MMRTLLLWTLSVCFVTRVAAAESADPFLWLEEANGERAMQWVRQENAKTARVLESDPRYETLLEQARHITEAKDRIPQPRFLAGQIYNFWQDAEHVHGIWRRTGLDDYMAAAPHWQTVLDLDALSRTEHANWFFKGADCVQPAENRCLVSLSDGGEDAVTIREFDLPSASFVAQGFTLPKGKQSAAWEAPDTLLVAREWAAGELTKSGYPFVVRRVQRGAPLESATEVFRGTPDDVMVIFSDLIDGEGNHALIIDRAITFFRAERYLDLPSGFARLAMPDNLEIVGLVRNRLILQIKEEWDGAGAKLPSGALIALDLSAAARDPGHLQPRLVYAAGEREAFVGALSTHGHLLLHALDNVNARVFDYVPEADGGWSRRAIALPDRAAIELSDADLHSERAFLTVTGFLTPPTLKLLDLQKHTDVTVKTLPAKFDATCCVVEQFSAKSKDGTQVPYFVVHARTMKLDGSTPTIMEAYGGFYVPMTPDYSGELGKLWLERGGAYVRANIRGGGEFGPRWHDAGVKLQRQRIYDDFSGVAQDLVRRGVTRAQRLGIRGGSNGGLLMGVEFTQHPELYAAVDIQVPLLDMLRYEQIAAGSSWVDEYGSTQNPQERQFLASISPYNNLRSGVRYPMPLIWTTTKDDRVGPQHARKFAAKLAVMGVPYLFYEVIEGGHAAGTTPLEEAQMAAREATYFSRQLMGTAQPP